MFLLKVKTSICLCQVVDGTGCLNQRSLQTKLKLVTYMPSYWHITDFDETNEAIFRMTGVDCLIITSYGISSKKRPRDAVVSHNVEMFVDLKKQFIVLRKQSSALSFNE